MSTEAWILLFATGGLALVSAAVSAIETALFSISPADRKQLEKTSKRRKHRLDLLLDHPSKTLNTLLLADSFLNVSVIFCALALVDRVTYFSHIPDWAAAAIALVGIGIFCELIPKVLATRLPIFLTRVGAPFARFLQKLLIFPARQMQQLSDRLIHHYTPVGTRRANELDEEELLTLLKISRKEKSLRKSEGSAIAEIVKLGDEQASHCVTPRVDIFTIPDDLSNERAIELLRTQRYARVLVTGETPDDVVGLLDVKELLLNPEIPYLELIEPPAFVPETMPALELFDSFLRHKQRFAILLDEYGGMEGIVTISDFVEEIFGEEGQGAKAELYLEKLDDERILASGSAKLDDLEEIFQVALEDEGADSLGGLIVNETGQVPRPGASIRIGDWRATVRRATRKRIKEVLLERVAGDESEILSGSGVGDVFAREEGVE
ncbi:MAG: hemolysin family protein [Chthoniobacterales bacterium]